MKPARKTFTFVLAVYVLFVVQAVAAPTIVPSKLSATYARGEPVRWTVSASERTGKLTFVIRKNNLDVVRSGEIDLSAGSTTIETKCDEPAMLYLELESLGANPTAMPVAVAGAAVAPDELQPCAPRPVDFDSFWESKIKLLQSIPANPRLTPADSGDPSIDYATIQMDLVNGTHVYGQLAKPKREGKFPAIVMFQWASPPYPLQRDWITQYAKNGWLVLDIEPHNVLPDQPKSYYEALPETLKHYELVGNDDRDESYFLRMYLRDYRAVDYIASRPDWDGKTLVALGTSMGGQQALCVAGLHPKVTHVVVNEPGGCDTNGPLHGRKVGYPFFPADNPKVMETALYFDTVNFAPRIKVPSLVAVGFVDTICPPTGVITAFNQIKGPKELVPMTDSPHNHLATPEQQRPWSVRSAQWLEMIKKGEDVTSKSTANAPTTAPTTAPTAAAPPPDDREQMMRQLGLKSVRPGADGNKPETYDEENAVRLLDTLPDVLKLSDGTKISRADQWPKRRAELVELFEREIYGRVPADVPKITWEVTSTSTGQSAGIPTVTKSLIGHVDNSACPALKVEIEARFTVPANATAPVPIMVVFGFGGRGFRPGTRPGAASRPAPPPGVPWTEQALAHGWGHATLVPTTVQPDNGALRTGIIGLTNKGEYRKPDQWGALRAWGWGVSRLIDYFEAHPESMVDAKKVGIEGVSRYGKAALVAQAFDERIAVGIIASSGEGGSKLHRHVFGERVENLCGGYNYWMAGNFMKYGASDPEMTAADLPVDSHELIALCAPRPCFISHGIPEKGDAKWIDARGSFMAGILASRVYELLGTHGFGVSEDIRTAQMPAVGQLIGGDLAWRQHEGGHDITPNWPTVFDWVGKYITAPPLPAAPTTKPASNAQSRAIVPTPRTDENSKIAHQQLVDKAKHGGIDLYFVGDSITRRWGCTDPQ